MSLPQQQSNLHELDASQYAHLQIPGRNDPELEAEAAAMVVSIESLDPDSAEYRAAMELQAAFI